MEVRLGTARWLSRGRVSSLIYTSREEVLVFLTLEGSTFDFVGDEEWWTKVAFLADLYDYLNKLNTNKAAMRIC